MCSEFVVEGSNKPFNIVHRCYFFAKEVTRFVKSQKISPVYFSGYSQLIRSATSIGANLVEGRAGGSRKDWRNFIGIALKSANETKYWLCLLRDSMDGPKERVEKLLSEAIEISKILGSILVKSNS
jgi:four helix bundle protein